MVEWKWNEKGKENLPHIISLGAGVQSSTVALLAVEGAIKPAPLCAIFADTQAEPASVYKWLDWLEGQLNFPVYRVTKGGIVDQELELTTSKKSGKVYRKGKIPFFTEEGGPLPRHCTKDFKIVPILNKVKHLVQIPRGCKEVKVVQWIGISTDEVVRMKPSPKGWLENRWPLIELGMSRKDCLAWWEKKKLPRPPRSACVMCPYHSDQEWLRLKTEEPEEFQKAVEFEKQVQEVNQKNETALSNVFLHNSCKPLSEVVFANRNRKTDQMSLFGGAEGFGNECEGMCGV